MNRELEMAYQEMGKRNEEQYSPIIKNLYGNGIFKTLDKYAIIDFQSEECCGELKSRTQSINDYNETMIGYNKIVEGFKKLNPNFKVYLWFAFKEGLYEFELNTKNFEKNGGHTQKRMAGTSNRGYSDFKQHYFIKTSLLKKISDVPVYINSLVEANLKKLKEEKKWKSNFSDEVCLLKIK